MTKRQDGRWVDSITLPNGKRKYFYGKTKREVLNKIRDYQVSTESAEQIPFRDVAAEYQTQCESRLSYNTVQQYGLWNRILIDYFGDTNVRDIRPKDISIFINRYIRLNNPASRTMSALTSYLSCLLRYAVSEGHIDTNPAREITLPHGLSKTERNVPTDDEIKTVIARQDLMLGRMFFFCLYTGLRRGELIALTWDDVDIDARIIRVTKSAYFCNGKSEIKDPKTKTGKRIVSIPDILIDKLHPSTGPVFPGRNGEIMNNTEYNHYVNQWRNETGTGCTMHQFRHAYATMLYDLGLDIKDSQRLLGHSDSSTTLNIYTHIRSQRETSVNDKVRSIEYRI